jgi:hypothetical protein
LTVLLFIRDYDEKIYVLAIKRRQIYSFFLFALGGHISRLIYLFSNLDWWVFDLRFEFFVIKSLKSSGCPATSKAYILCKRKWPNIIKLWILIWIQHIFYCAYIHLNNKNMNFSIESTIERGYSKIWHETVNENKNSNSRYSRWDTFRNIKLQSHEECWRIFYFFVSGIL